MFAVNYLFVNTEIGSPCFICLNWYAPWLTTSCSFMLHS